MTGAKLSSTAPLPWQRQRARSRRAAACSAAPAAYSRMTRSQGEPSPAKYMSIFSFSHFSGKGWLCIKR